MDRRRLAALGLACAVVATCATPVPPPSPTAPPASPASPAPTPGPSATRSESAAPSPTPTAVPTPSSSGTPRPPSATLISHGPRDRKAVALTFDDGFNVPACISIVGTLLAKHASATFFPNGQYVRESPSFWRWVAAEGFPVGSHGTTHHDPTTLSADQLMASLDSERRILDGTLGVQSIDAYRPAYGSFNSLVLEVAGLAGYPVAVEWDVDSRDQLGIKTVAEEVADATTGTNGSIVLMHCGSPFTPLALATVVDLYRARGFAFVTIPDLIGLETPTAAWSPMSAPDSWPIEAIPSQGPGPAWNGSIAFDAAGHRHVAFETATGIVVEDDAAGSWRWRVVAHGTASVFVSRPSLAVDAAGLGHLVYLSASTSGTQLLYSRQGTDGTWSSPSLVAVLGAPASTATIALEHTGRPVVAFARLTGATEGLVLARPGSTGWSLAAVPTTDGTFLGPSVAIDGAGAIHVFARRNGRSELDETTDASGTWTTTAVLRVRGSAIPFAGFDTAGRLVLAAQPLFGGDIEVGTRPLGGSFSWAPVTTQGDLSGLAAAPDGTIVVVFSRVLESGGPSRLWLAHSPG